MEGYLAFVAVVLIIAYVALAIYTIVKSDGVGQGIGTTIAFTAGGCVVIPVATFFATILCWGIVIVLVLAIIGFFGSLAG